VLVGLLAALVHWSVVVALVSRAGWPPLRANVAGWLVALAVSYTGHFNLSFRGSGAGVVRSAPRFALLSAAGFALNESVYALALHGGGWRYDAVLGVVLAGVAVVTYWASRRWAFVRSPG